MLSDPKERSRKYGSVTSAKPSFYIKIIQLPWYFASVPTVLPAFGLGIIICSVKMNILRQRVDRRGACQYYCWTVISGHLETTRGTPWTKITLAERYNAPSDGRPTRPCMWVTNLADKTPCTTAWEINRSLEAPFSSLRISTRCRGRRMKQRPTASSAFASTYSCRV